MSDAGRHKPWLRNLYLFGILILIVLLWPTAVLAPMKILVVFFHESSHALMTLLTGGHVKEMVISADQGGHVLSQGGNRFLTLNAGYLGSLMWGMAIYTLAVKSHQDRTITAALGVTIIVLTVIFMRNLYGIGFGLLAGAGLIILARWASNAMNDFLLRLTGLTSMLYAPLDIYSDTISRSYLRSDARMLAEEIGGATLLWGAIWIAISTVTIGVLLWVIHFQSGRNH